jgi:hypothetical protein
MVIAATAAGQLERAWAAFDELDQQPELWLTPALAAYRAQAWAELGFAEAQIDAAIAALRNALEQWQRLDAPLHVAGTKLRLVQMLMAQGQTEAAELELTAAERLFDTLAVPRRLQRCQELRREYSLMTAPT